MYLLYQLRRLFYEKIYLIIFLKVPFPDTLNENPPPTGFWLLFVSVDCQGNNLSYRQFSSNNVPLLYYWWIFCLIDY